MNSTIINNVKIIKFMLKNIETYLDKLTRNDAIDFCDALADWQRKDRKSISLSTVKEYRIGLHTTLRTKRESHISFIEVNYES